MEQLKIDTSPLLNFVHNDTLNTSLSDLQASFGRLVEQTGEGSEFTGWLKLPEGTSEGFLSEIKGASQMLSGSSETVVVIGIGGSYLGAKAVLEALKPHFSINIGESLPEIVFAGHNLSSSYHYNLLKYLDTKEYSIIVISKSGTTTEPAIAFRLIKNHIEKKYGKERAGKRIVAITDASKGALRKMSDIEGYKTFIVPDDVGGRFSVLTPVGLLPLAVAGADIEKLIEGAFKMSKHIMENPNCNPATDYALARTAMYRSGKPIEVMVAYEPELHYIAEWWKQLFGESEGKGGKGIFPASVINTTDLHSMGQYIQDGMRVLFETVLSIENPYENVHVPSTPDNLDGLNYLAGKDLHSVNLVAEEATRQAHIQGGVPNMRITLPMISEYYLGQLLYMFEFACGISAYMLKVNPFDQPGVEAYKSNMFKLLGKHSTK